MDPLQKSTVAPIEEDDECKVKTNKEEDGDDNSYCGDNDILFEVIDDD